MNELPAGHDAVLLDFATEPHPSEAVTRAAQALRVAVSTGRLGRVDEIIPSATTILVQFHSDAGADVLGIHRALRSAGDLQADNESAATETVIPVHYDGADLAAVAELLGVDTAQVVTLHHQSRWRVQFMGFAPGFGYLVPHHDHENPLTRIGRRSEPRTRVPAGAVAIAAGYSAVYPRASPGGWHLLGHTDIRLWDAQSSTPSLLRPGAVVRFVDLADPESRQQ